DGDQGRAWGNQGEGVDVPTEASDQVMEASTPSASSGNPVSSTNPSTTEGAVVESVQVSPAVTSSAAEPWVPEEGGGGMEVAGAVGEDVGERGETGGGDESKEVAQKDQSVEDWAWGNEGEGIAEWPGSEGEAPAIAPTVVAASESGGGAPATSGGQVAEEGAGPLETLAAGSGDGQETSGEGGWWGLEGDEAAAQEESVATDQGSGDVAAGPETHTSSVGVGAGEEVQDGDGQVEGNNGGEGGLAWSQ
ncbi:unnamed protein product, partial [Ascophyllum nodosum]